MYIHICIERERYIHDMSVVQMYRHVMFVKNYEFLATKKRCPVVPSPYACSLS